MTHVFGIHHVTAIAGDPQRNVDFYAGVLGLRLVKRTVNFDAPETYHLYYGDEVGTPGSIMTFFPWPGARPGRAGPRQAAVTAFAVPPAAIGFWIARLVQHGVAHESPAKRTFGGVDEIVLAFRDPDGLLVEIVGHPGAERRPAWADAPGVPPEHAIRGFHSVTLWVADAEPTERVLVDVLGHRLVGELGNVRRFEAGEGGPSTFVDVRTVGGFAAGVGGAGTVHHVAFRVPDDAGEFAVRERVTAAGLHATEQLDRNYFRSVYFREPGGVLFELATDVPGFTVDEPADKLGLALQLPPQYEPRRAEIEAVLPPLRVPSAASAAEPGSDGVEAADDAGPVRGESLGYVHRHVPATDAGVRTTLLLLHGTGGDEADLLPLGRRLVPGAALLSPRGNVRENGMPRFFRRIAEGVFDQADLARRTGELAEFVDGAARAYAFDRSDVIAVGFSNGANIAASLLLRRGAVLRGAVLLSPMLPFEPDGPVPSLAGTAVFIGAGRHDPLVPAAQVERLAGLLRDAGAEVSVHWTPGGHAITPHEVEAARAWVDRLTAGAAAAPAAGG